MLENLKQEERD